MSETFLKAGEKMKVTYNGKPTEFTVKPSCEKNDGGQWFCATHDKGFNSNMNADFHTSSGRHKMVWFCFEHQFEEVQS